MSATSHDHNAGRLHRFNRVAVADTTEQLLVLSVYLYLVWRLLVPVIDGRELANLLLLTSEGLVVAFLILRRPATRISSSWLGWGVALSATLVPMLVNPSNGGELAPPTVCAGLMVAGMVVQVHAKLALGRSFGCVPAHRGLKVSGPYHFVRHPMYAGYALSHAAYLLMNPTVGNAVVYAATYALQIPRILEEERLLAGDPQYRQYQSVVRYRLIPGIF